MKPPQNDRLATIMSLEAELDIRHDSILHGTHGALTSMAGLAGGDEGDVLRALRDRLLPDVANAMVANAELTDIDAGVPGWGAAGLGGPGGGCPDGGPPVGVSLEGGARVGGRPVGGPRFAANAPSLALPGVSDGSS